MPELPPVAPEGSLSTAQDLLRMLRGRRAEPAFEQALDIGVGDGNAIHAQAGGDLGELRSELRAHFPQVREFFFDDDTFTDNLPRAEEIARELGKLGVALVQLAVPLVVAVAVFGGAYAAHVSAGNALRDETDKFLAQRAAEFVARPPGATFGATTTSRPVRMPPSTCTVMRERRRLSTSV